MSIAIDPKAGSHFTGDVYVTSHAISRAVTHFNIDIANATAYVIGLLRKAALVSECVIDDTGKPARMFAYRHTAFIVHPTEARVYTLYPQYSANESVRSPIEKLIQRAIKSAERKESREVKRINVSKAELSIERANYELRRAKSDSIRIIAEMSDKIANIDASLTQLDRELIEVRREKTNVMKSVVAYV